MRRPILRLGFGGSMLLALVMGWWYFLPTPLFTVPYSTVILDKEGEIMGMTVASDGQYRVSGRGRLSMKYMAALLCFEDKRFLTHSGVDPLAIGRALWLNVRSGSVVSGGSTLTMQAGDSSGTELHEMGDSEYVRGPRPLWWEYRGNTGGITKIF